MTEFKFGQMGYVVNIYGVYEAVYIEKTRVSHMVVIKGKRHFDCYDNFSIEKKGGCLTKKTGLKASFGVKIKSSIKLMILSNNTIRRLLELIPSYQKIKADEIIKDHKKETKEIFIEMENEE